MLPCPRCKRCLQRGNQTLDNLSTTQLHVHFGVHHWLRCRPAGGSVPYLGDHTGATLDLRTARHRRVSVASETRCGECPL